MNFVTHRMAAVRSHPVLEIHHGCMENFVDNTFCQKVDRLLLLRGKLVTVVFGPPGENQKALMAAVP